MQVFIVSKTRMNKSTCVGGVLENGRLVRLLNANGYQQDTDTNLQIGEAYEIKFTEKQGLQAPHVEDICVTSWQRKGHWESTSGLASHLEQNLRVKVWEGGPESMFEGALKWTDRRSGYINQEAIPDRSVGFWRPDRFLSKTEFEGKTRYSYLSPEGVWYNISFVGFQEPVSRIEAGTLLRVSLARWWAPEESEDERRCYLQLSGWY